MREVEWNKKALRVIEEAGEVVQAYGKMGRFGLVGYEPLSGKSYDNKQDFIDEMIQLREAIDELLKCV